MVSEGVRQVMNMILGPQGIKWHGRRALCEFVFLAVWGECIVRVCRDASSAWCDCDWLMMEAVLELGLEGLLTPRPLPQFQAKSEASFI